MEFQLMPSRLSFLGSFLLLLLALQTVGAQATIIQQSLGPHLNELVQQAEGSSPGAAFMHDDCSNHPYTGFCQTYAAAGRMLLRMGAFMEAFNFVAPAIRVCGLSAEVHEVFGLAIMLGETNGHMNLLQPLTRETERGPPAMHRAMALFSIKQAMMRYQYPSPCPRHKHWKNKVKKLKRIASVLEGLMPKIEEWNYGYPDAPTDISPHDRSQWSTHTCVDSSRGDVCVLTNVCLERNGVSMYLPHRTFTRESECAYDISMLPCPRREDPGAQKQQVYSLYGTVFPPSRLKKHRVIPGTTYAFFLRSETAYGHLHLDVLLPLYETMMREDGFVNRDARIMALGDSHWLTNPTFKELITAFTKHPIMHKADELKRGSGIVYPSPKSNPPDLTGVKGPTGPGFERMVLGIRSDVIISFSGDVLKHPASGRDHTVIKGYVDHILRHFGMETNAEMLQRQRRGNFTLPATFLWSDRGCPRSTINKNELLGKLSSAGLRGSVVDFNNAMSVFEQIKAVRSASLMVGVAGSGLINSWFLPPKAGLIQLWPSAVSKRHSRSVCDPLGAITNGFRLGRLEEFNSALHQWSTAGVVADIEAEFGLCADHTGQGFQAAMMLARQQGKWLLDIDDCVHLHVTWLNQDCAYHPRKFVAAVRDVAAEVTWRLENPPLSNEGFGNGVDNGYGLGGIDDNMISIDARAGNRAGPRFPTHAH